MDKVWVGGFEGSDLYSDSQGCSDLDKTGVVDLKNLIFIETGKGLGSVDKVWFGGFEGSGFYDRR